MSGGVYEGRRFTPADIAPTRLEWVGPNGFHVFLDEDQVSLQPGSHGLEEPEIDRLLAIIASAKAARKFRVARTPRVPTPEDRRRFGDGYVAERVARKAAQAIREELNPF